MFARPSFVCTNGMIRKARGSMAGALLHRCDSARRFLQANMTAAKEVYGAWEDTWHTQKPGDTRQGPVLCSHVHTVLAQLFACRRHASQALQQAVNTCKGQSSSRHAGAWRMCLLHTAGISGRSHKSPVHAELPSRPSWRMQQCRATTSGCCMGMMTQ